MAKKFIVLADETDKVDVEFTLPPYSNLSEVLDQFTFFLKACGYFFDGKVDIVDEKNT